MVFTPLVTLSVNQAKVVPTSITTHSSMAITLVASARFVRRPADLCFLMFFAPLIRCIFTVSRTPPQMRTAFCPPSMVTDNRQRKPPIFRRAYPVFFLKKKTKSHGILRRTVGSLTVILYHAQRKIASPLSIFSTFFFIASENGKFWQATVLLPAVPAPPPRHPVRALLVTPRRAR